MTANQWYYCLDHRAVEPYEGCRNATRLGPYSSAEDAEHALEKVAQRNEDWDNDPRFNDDLPEDEAEEGRSQPGPLGND